MNTLDRVVRVITVHFGMPEGEVTASKAIVDDLGADSLDTIEIIMAIEEEFNIEVVEQELISKCEVLTVQSAADMIDKIRAQR